MAYLLNFLSICAVRLPILFTVYPFPPAMKITKYKAGRQVRRPVYVLRFHVLRLFRFTSQRPHVTRPHLVRGHLLSLCHTINYVKLNF